MTKTSRYGAPPNPVNRTPLTEIALRLGCDTITILVAHDGIAAKTLSLDKEGALQVVGYNAGTWFYARPHPVGSLDDLAVVLDALQREPKAFVIRGTPLTSIGMEERVRRTKATFPTPKAGHQWLMLDFDAIDLPDGMGVRTNTADVIEHLVQQLPAEFHHASYYWQLSAKAGFTADNVVSMHLWFWLAKPTTDKQLKDWAKAWNTKTGYKLIDPALFNDVQPHFTSAPILVGLDDPFPVRSGLVSKAVAAVDLATQPAPNRVSVPAHQPSAKTSTWEEPGESFQRHLADIGDHPGGGGFHDAIVAAAASFVATHTGDEIDPDELKATLRDAILKADRSRHEDAYVEEMAGDDHLNAAIQSAITKFGEANRARRKPRVIAGIKPHYATKPQSVAQATQRLAAEVEKFFAGGKPF